MRKILTGCLAPFIFILFFFFAGNASAGALPDWGINFTWNGVGVTDGAQYPFHLNEEKPSSYAWPGGDPNIYGEIYKGELHNAVLASEHELGNVSPSLKTDAFLEPGHYFVVIYTDYYPRGGCGDAVDYCIIPDREEMQSIWFRGWEGFFDDAFAPLHWGIINFEVTEAIDEPPPIDPLILKYEPILYLHPDESYQPMNVEAYVKHSSLWEFNDVLSDNLLKAENETDPVMLDDIAAITDSYNWYLQFVDGLEEGPLGKTADPIKAQIEYQQMKNNDELKYTYYTTKLIDKDEENNKEYTVLEYWFFYAMNDFGAKLGGNNHEGDWESVMIFLDKETEEPKYIAYSSHYNRGRIEDPLEGQYLSVRRSWENSDVLKYNSHVVSFVGLGSHANFPNNGENGVHYTPAFEDDLTSYNGPHLENEIWNKTELKQNNLPAWVLNYKGRWGTVYTAFGTYGAGHLYPGMNNRFIEPVKWAGIDKIGEKTIIETGIDTVNFVKQKTKLVFDQILDMGTSFVVDLHDELIDFGENIQEVTLLPYFWDISSSLENNTFGVKVSFGYNEEDLNLFGAPEDLLSVFVFDEVKKVWEEIPSIIDAAGNIVSFMTTHFSKYAIGVKNWQDVTNNLKIIKNSRHYNPETGTVYVDVKMQNRTDENIAGDLRLVIKYIDKEGVELLNNTGTTTEELPYVDVKLESLLTPKHLTKPIKLEFSLPIKKTKIIKTKKEEKTIYIPEFIKFDFEVEVLNKVAGLELL